MVMGSGGKLKRIYWVLLIVVLLLVIYQIAHEDALVQPDQRLQELQDLPAADAVINPASPVTQNAEKTLQRAQQVLSGKSAQVDAADPAVASTKTAAVAWQTGNPDSVTMPLPNGVTIYEPVSVNMDSPVYPLPGEQMTLPMPGGENLVVNVESSNENPNGDYSWRGHLDGQGTDYPVVMTYGGNSVFATVTTPKGSYTLESVNGSGWIYKNPAEVELSQPGKNDYLEVPHLHDHE